MITSTPVRLKPFLDLVKLADEEHKIWSHWMKYLFSVGKFNEDGTWTMPKWAVDRWLRQANARYQDLTDKEKRSDQEVVLEHHKHLINQEEICEKCYKSIVDKVKMGGGDDYFCYECGLREVESPSQMTIVWKETSKSYFSCKYCFRDLGPTIFTTDDGEHFCCRGCRDKYISEQGPTELKVTATCDQA